MTPDEEAALASLRGRLELLSPQRRYLTKVPRGEVEAALLKIEEKTKEAEEARQGQLFQPKEEVARG